MSRFLNPTGNATYGIALCARCSRKFFLHELSPDPNSPGLMVCAKDRDVLDPYRLPARKGEDIHLPFVRPDESIALSGTEPDVAPYFGRYTIDSTVITIDSTIVTIDRV